MVRVRVVFRFRFRVRAGVIVSVRISELLESGYSKSTSLGLWL